MIKKKNDNLIPKQNNTVQSAYIDNHWEEIVMS